MSILGRFRRFLFAPDPTDDYWYEDAPSGFQGRLSIRDALQVTALYACVRVIAETIASLPCFVYERLPGGGRNIARNHPIYDVVHDRAHDYWTAFEFWEALSWSILLHGNALALLDLDSRRNVETMIPLEWPKITVGKDQQTGIRIFRYSPDGGPTQDFTDADVLFIPGPGYDGQKGYSPVDLHKDTLSISTSAREYIKSHFLNNASPDRYLTSPQILSEKAKDNLLKWFSNKFGGPRRAGKLGVLDAGLEIKHVPRNHAEMQLVELQKFYVEEFCRIYRVPPHLVQDLSRSTNNNIEHQGIDFATHCIRPWLERIESRANMSLLGPLERQRFYIEFSMDALLRGDAASRASYYSTMIQNAAMKPNEAREKENLNPEPGGDVLLRNSSLIPLAEVTTSPVDNKREEVPA